MTTNQLDPQRPLKGLPDAELDNRWESIMHSIVQATGGISFWKEELDAIRDERKERAKERREQLEPLVVSVGEGE